MKKANWSLFRSSVKSNAEVDAELYWVVLRASKNLPMAFALGIVILFLGLQMSVTCLLTAKLLITEMLFLPLGHERWQRRSETETGGWTAG